MNTKYKNTKYKYKMNSTKAPAILILEELSIISDTIYSEEPSKYLITNYINLLKIINTFLFISFIK